MERLNRVQKENRRRIVELTYRHKLSHLGSTLSAVDSIDAIYNVIEPNEKFILSSGHAGLAQYVVLERHHKLDAEKILEHHGVHPDQCCQCHLDCSTGSLGQGLPIAVGMALADRSKNVYCQVSDGEMAEGSIWEALRIAQEQELGNLKVVLNMNGYGAYDEINTRALTARVRAFQWRVLNVNGHNPDRLLGALLSGEEPDYLKDVLPPTLIVAKTNVEQLPFLKGLSAHYLTMNEDQYKQAMEYLI